MAIGVQEEVATGVQEDVATGAQEEVAIGAQEEVAISAQVYVATIPLSILPAVYSEEYECLELIIVIIFCVAQVINQSLGAVSGYLC